ncbi:MAG: hypothetical protein OFPI_45260 [Osedax symbiont Rs2]|nr:MAG: hypothetical protein OFPI_45260 [Osedax symbiont Rs2]EPJ43066.1 MAG: hypothetical protein OFPII_43770 [Osedax symbiont Rs1]
MEIKTVSSADFLPDRLASKSKPLTVAESPIEKTVHLSAKGTEASRNGEQSSVLYSEAMTSTDPKVRKIGDDFQKLAIPQWMAEYGRIKELPIVGTPGKESQPTGGKDQMTFGSKVQGSSRGEKNQNIAVYSDLMVNFLKDENLYGIEKVDERHNAFILDKEKSENLRVKFEEIVADYHRQNEAVS